MPNRDLVIEDRLQLESYLLSPEMNELVTDSLSLLQEVATVPRLDFPNPSLNDEDYLARTDWTKE